MVAPGLAITTFMNSLTMTIPAILGIILLIGIYVDKEPLLDFGKALAHAVPWDAMLLIMCVMMFGTLVTLPNLGITATLTSLVAPLAEHMTFGGWLVGFLVAAAVIVVTNFFANSPTMMIFLAAIVPVAGMFNANGYACSRASTAASSSSIRTSYAPASSPASASRTASTSSTSTSSWAAKARTAFSVRSPWSCPPRSPEPRKLSETDRKNVTADPNRSAVTE